MLADMHASSAPQLAAVLIQQGQRFYLTSGRCGCCSLQSPVLVTKYSIEVYV